jgi:glycosyltransferase involved in cell wall biosynthesis
MLISVATPTHDPRWLLQAYRSLQRQTYQHFEWVIVPNGEAAIPEVIAQDSRVRICRPTSSQVIRVGPLDVTSIGGLKRYAFGQCRGDLLVELDHDDLLTPGCLAALAVEVGRRPVGTPLFLYSDFANFYEGSALPETYSDISGWEKYDVTVAGQTYTAMRAFPPEPRSLCEIYYAPNHVRAWTRSAYEQAGGHDEKMTVGDDHDLICRTYLAGVDFVHVPSCLYLYRRLITEKTHNSFAERQEGVRKQSTINRNRYLHQLVTEWCRRHELPLFRLGGGPRREIPHMRSIDDHDAEILWDYRGDPLPLADSSVGAFLATSFLQRVPRHRFIDVMNDIYRVLMPGGFLLSVTPSTDGRAAFGDPAAVNFINQNTFHYLTDRSWAAQLPSSRSRFQTVRLFTAWPTAWHRDHQLYYVVADLCALKGQRQAGPVGI